MDVNITLLVLVVISCGATLWRALKSPWWRSLAGTILVSSVILVLAIVLYLSGSENAGAFTAILWVALVLGPSLILRLANRYALQQNYPMAEHVMQIATLLHPYDGWRDQARLIHAQGLAQRGNLHEAIASFKRYETQDSPAGRRARLQLYRLQNRWSELVAWIDATPNLEGDIQMLGLYIRALGEIGDLNRMLATFERYQDRINQARQTPAIGLFLFAFGGQPAAIIRLFDGTLHLYPRPVRKYWFGVANFAAGNADSARADLEEAVATGDAGTHAAAQRRLTQPPAVAAEVLTPASRQILVQAEHDLDQAQRYNTLPTAGRKPPYATYALIAINVVVFILETTQGGSENLETLYRLGALDPSVVLAQGEWWRLLAAMFLHLGWLHIAVNMLALVVIGPFVEYTLGFARYLLTYFVTGLGSMLVIVLLTAANLLGPELLVGASGAIMGLVGATGAILYRGWRVEKAPIAGQRLRSIAFLVIAQVILDLGIIPGTSLPGHLSGAVIGFIFVSLLPYQLQKTAQPVVQR